MQKSVSQLLSPGNSRVYFCWDDLLGTRGTLVSVELKSPESNTSCRMVDCIGGVGIFFLLAEQ